MPRASLSVERDVADEFSLQAERKGKTLYTFANEWLQAASKISAEGGTAKDVLDHWRVLAILSDVEVITLPAEFVERLIAQLYAVEKENLFKIFNKLGSDLVNFMKMVAPDVEQLAVLAKEFAAIIPTKRIDIQKTDDSTVTVNIVGAGRHLETTECSFEFVKGIINGYGYNISSQEIGVGTIRIQARRRGL